MTSIISKWKDILSRFSGKGIYPTELAFLLDNPLRKFILSPKNLSKRLHLSSNQTVLEIGSGPGYFSAEVAKNIPNGYLVLFDVQSEMLLKGRNKLRHNKVSNAFYVQGDAELLPFNAEVFDAVFLVTVLGEVTNPKECLIAINKVLKNYGTLSVTEMKGDPDIIPQDELKNLVNNCGFEFYEIFSSRTGYTMNFKKISSPIF